MPVYAVGEAGSDDAELDRKGRLAALGLAQRLLRAGEPGLLLMDEADDVRAVGGPRRGAKAFVHHLLETTPVPIVWTTSCAPDLGPAVLRRMTYAIRFVMPPVAARTAVWGRLLERAGVTLPAAEVTSLARTLEVAPALAQTAVRPAARIGGGALTIRRAVGSLAALVHGGWRRGGARSL